MRDDDVRLVLDFLNTVDYEDHIDQLDTEAGWLAWTSARRLAEGHREHARSVRDALRAAVGDLATHPILVTVPIQVSLIAGRPTLTSQDAVGEVLAAAARLEVLAEWERIKICPADNCRWAFFDRSRNRSRTWCSMRVCGNREKARAWRERAKTS